MKEADYISRIDSGDQDFEFKNLRDIGIEEIQRLSGNQWTDYNIHDPGITILEQLCFAITELGYKTDFDIKDLLSSQHIDPETSGTFFTASNVLQGKPITIHDYRKLLIDRIDGLRDVWIEPLNLHSDNTKIKGMYLALIKSSSERIKTDVDKKRLISETRKCLEEHSNLGESFNDILILDEVEIIVSGKIELLKEVNAENTHARILYNIQQFISSPIRFYSLDQMLKTGLSVEDIFSGPRLKNGFIKDEDLKDKMKILITSDLINIINKVDGVSKVLSLQIKSIENYKEEKDRERGITDKDVLLIDLNKVATLAELMIPDKKGVEQTLVYYQNNQKVNLFNKKVVRYFRQIKNESNIKYATDYKSSNDISIKKGNPRPIDEYFSIQEHFPSIYAVGRQGIPPDLETKKVNQVKQLKAYLLVFETLLSNYLAQLTNFSSLFSLDETLTKSYFAGGLQSVPYIRELLVGLNTATSSDNEVARKTKEISQQALKVIDNFNKRRHRALDHLLARFGEQVSNFGIEKYNYYYDEEKIKEIKLLAKINYLKELVSLSSSKVTLNDEEYTIENYDKNPPPLNISYLEKKAKIRLGIPLQKNQLSKNIIRNKPKSQISINKIANLISNDNRMLSKQFVMHTIADGKLKEENFNPEIDIDFDLLKRGVWAENYRVISDNKNSDEYRVVFFKKLNYQSLSDPEKEEFSQKLEELTVNLDPKPDFIRFLIEENNTEFVIEFDKEINNKYNTSPYGTWQVIKTLNTKVDAEKFIRKMTFYLADLNINMEEFYLIDHIDLRPRNKNDRYGIVIKNRVHRTGFVSANQYNYYEVQKALKELVSDAKVATYKHENASDGEIQTSLEYKGKIIGKYLNLNPNQSLDRDSRVNDLKALFESLNEFDLHDPSIIQFYSVKDIYPKIDEATFFSFRLSIIIPSWPSRFADVEFRKVLEATIRADAPAHIGIDFYYLNFEKIRQFKKLYNKWLNDLRQKSSENFDKMNKRSEDLAVYIKTLAREKIKNATTKINA